MEKMKNKLMQLWKNEEGATMVEYGVMVALIAAVCIIVVQTLGESIMTTFSNVGNAVNAANTAN